MHLLWIWGLTALLSGLWLPASPTADVRHIIMNAPEGLDTATLLVPRFDLLDPETGATGVRRDLIVRINKEAKRSNSALVSVLDKAYPYPYKLVSLRHVEAMRASGYRYYLDMVLMPKQMEVPKREAMVPTYEQYETANKMYTNRYTQFHYYFYIRDLETGDAYMGTRLRSHFETYPALQRFCKQVVKDYQRL